MGRNIKLLISQLSASAMFCITFLILVHPPHTVIFNPRETGERPEAPVTFWIRSPGCQGTIDPG